MIVSNILVGAILPPAFTVTLCHFNFPRLMFQDLIFKVSSFRCYENINNLALIPQRSNTNSCDTHSKNAVQPSKRRSLVNQEVTNEDAHTKIQDLHDHVMLFHRTSIQNGLCIAKAVKGCCLKDPCTITE